MTKTGSGLKCSPVEKGHDVSDDSVIEEAAEAMRAVRREVGPNPYSYTELARAAFAVFTRREGA